MIVFIRSISDNQRLKPAPKYWRGLYATAHAESAAGIPLHLAPPDTLGRLLWARIYPVFPPRRLLYGVGTRVTVPHHGAGSTLAAYSL